MSPPITLDLEMRQSLAVALQDYPGAVVLVSHDRHLLNAVADEFLIVGNGRAELFDGDLEDYARWLSASQQAPAMPAEAALSAAANSRQRRQVEAQARARLAPLRAAIDVSEKALNALAAQRASLEESLASPGLYVPAEKSRLQALLADRQRLARETAAAEEAWLEASEQLEASSRCD